ncbi:MAG: ATP-dependent protease ATPase subunit HslU [Planctomycetes bacterium]|nr:ATP-dependent protease ATPase subunit HslU [Planctomycetota bacterium]
MTDNLTPREILAALDSYVVGQDKAKRAVSVALRNRWRRRQLDREIAADVYPKNILLIGPTGVGKTEIARRLADLSRSPFVKVEATKYSEVGYHGRDVESMVRDLAESAVAIVRHEHQARVRERAEELTSERLLLALCDARGIRTPIGEGQLGWRVDDEGMWRPTTTATGDPIDLETDASAPERERLREELARGALDHEVVEIEVRDQRTPTLNIMGPQGNDAMGIDAQALQELWGRSPGGKTRVRKLAVRDARALIHEEEASRLVDEESVFAEALERAENDGIVFIDEVDKVVGGGGDGGPDVSREGVQRDLLSIVEGCAVYTRYGHVRTDHMLFIAAGAFHFHKPSELIPELQGRFPVRVALRPLTEADFVRILTEPRNSLVRQYTLLFETEGVDLRFTEDGLRRIAELAFRANQTTQDIGARRLFTILEKCLEDLSFRAAEMRGESVVVDRGLVDSQLGETPDDEDLIPYDV